MVAFSMFGQAQVWWESKERELTVAIKAITWELFLQEMQDKYVLSVIKDRKAVEFTNLVQGAMIVTEYETKFEELSKYAPNVIATE